jgi:hypothetical protein
MKTRGVFDFHADGVSGPQIGGHIVRIMRGTDDKEGLLRSISAGLKFPEYFGFNWDSLDECLADLSWLDTGDVLIWHEIVPLSSNTQELTRYLDVLRTAQQEATTRSIVVSFPESGRETVTACLR